MPAPARRHFVRTNRIAMTDTPPEAVLKTLPATPAAERERIALTLALEGLAIATVARESGRERLLAALAAERAALLDEAAYLTLDRVSAETAVAEEAAEIAGRLAPRRDVLAAGLEPDKQD